MLFTKQIAEANARTEAAQGQFTSLRAALESGGLFALATDAEGKFSVALTDAGKAKFAEGTADLTAQLTDATASVASLTTEKVALEGKLATASSTERERIKAAVETTGLFGLAFDGEGKPSMSLTGGEGLFALAQAEGGKLMLALTEAGETKFVNAKASRVLAAAGHEPLPLAIDTPAGTSGASSAPTGKGRTQHTWNK